VLAIAIQISKNLLFETISAQELQLTPILLTKKLFTLDIKAAENTEHRHSVRRHYMDFKDLQLTQSIQRALDKKAYTEPTPIQEQAIPVVLSGEDLLAIAQTGTGKTAAFALPIIQLITQNNYHKEKKRSVKALIVTPTRELAIQIDECFSDFTMFTNLKHTVVYGGVNQNPQVDRLKSGVDILIATPGRLLDLVQQGLLSLNNVRYFVLDEADRMLDMGFVHDIRKIIALVPKKRQTMLFSATMPDAITKLAQSFMYQPIKVEVTPSASVVDTIKQELYYVEKTEKNALLIELLKKSDKRSSTLVFSRTKHGADRIARTLTRNGIGCDSIHGNKSQNARQTALSNFKSGKTHVIVATDIASRGIDIANLDRVINYDMPDVAETYVHRIGRTGRAGNSGEALSFCTQEDKSMVKEIQKLTGTKLPTATMPALA